MNRQQRRLVQRQGQTAEDGRPEVNRLEASDLNQAEPAEAGQPDLTERRPTRPVSGAPRRRATPRQFLHEVNVEMRKVAWPTRAETINYSTVVFITLAILMALIFGLDLGFSKLAVFLFK